MRAERVSTIGKERALNYALRAPSKEEFVRMVTADLPERPAYFATDAELNRLGAAPLVEAAPLPLFTPSELMKQRRAGAVILDTRPTVQFGAGHVPGAVNIPLAGAFAPTAAALLGLDHDILLIAEDEPALAESRLRLARVGLERVTGALGGGMAKWAEEKMPTAQILQIPADELRRELTEDPGGVQVIDVRRPDEWSHGHISSALHKPLNHVEEMLADLDRTRPIVVHCKGGARSAIACSLIQRAGFENVANLVGGLDAWQAFGFPVTTPN